MGAISLHDVQLNKSELILYAISFLVSAVSGLLTAITPIRALKIGGGPIELGLLGSLGPLIYSPTTILAGMVSDRFGRKPFVVLSTLLYALTCTMYYFSKDIPGMLFSRCLEGISLAILWPPLESLLSRVSSKDPQEIASKFGISWSSGSSLGALTASASISTITFETATASSVLVLVLCTLATLFIPKETSKTSFAKQVYTDAKKSTSELMAWALAFTYSFSQGIAFFIYPAFSDLLGNPPVVSLLLSSSVMLGRTIAFGFGKTLTSKVNLGLILIFASAAILPIATASPYPSVFFTGLSFGLGVGICYLASLDFAVHSSPSDRGKYTGRFEGSLGIGYLVGPIAAGTVFPITPFAPFILTLSLNTWLLALNLTKKRYEVLRAH